MTPEEARSQILSQPLTQRVYLRLRAAAMSSDKKAANQAKSLLSEIATKHENENFREGARRMLWEATNPDQPYPAKQQVPAGFVEAGLGPLMDAASRETVSTAEPTRERVPGSLPFGPERSPAKMKQTVYNVLTAPTLGHNVLPAAIDRLTGQSEFTPEAMAEAERINPLSNAEFVVSTLGLGGFAAGKALKPIMKAATSFGNAGNVLPAMVKGGAVAGGATNALNLASAAAEGALSRDPRQSAGGNVEATANDPLQALLTFGLGGLGGAAGATGNALVQRNPGSRFLTSKGAKVGLTTSGKGKIFEGPIGRKGIDRGEVNEATLSSAADEAAAAVNQALKNRHIVAGADLARAKAAATNPYVDHTPVYERTQFLSQTADTPPSARGQIARAFKEYFVNPPEVDAVDPLNAVLVEPMKGGARFPLAEGGVVPGDKVLMHASRADAFRRRMGKIWDPVSQSGKSPEAGDIAALARRSLEETDFGRANLAYADEAARLKGDRGAIGYPKSEDLEIWPRNPTERSSLASKLLDIAVQRARGGTVTDELNATMQGDPYIGNTVDELTALAAKRDLQSPLPHLNPYASSGGRLNVAGGVRIGGAMLPRLVAPLLKAESALTPYALSPLERIMQDERRKANP